MELIRTGINYNSASIAFREKLHFNPGETTALLDAFAGDELIESGVILSTCARTEIYFTPGPALQDPRQPLLRICENRDVELPRELDQIYTSRGLTAVRRCFRVVGGLDSLIFGESEILGQTKAAYERAAEAGYCDSLLHRLFQEAFRLGKDIQSLEFNEAGPTSLGETVTAVARDKLDSLANRGSLVLGAGTIGKLCLQSLEDAGVSNFFVLGRNQQRTREKIASFEARAVNRNQLPELADQLDLIISASSSNSTLLTKNQLAEIQASRSGPLVVIDLAVPRDVDPEAAQLDNLQLFNVDKLRNMTREKFEQTSFYQTAQRRIDRGVQKFEAWVRSRAAAPLFHGLQESFQDSCRTVLAEYIREHDQLDASELDELADQLANKLLNSPLRKFKTQLQSGDGAESAAVLSELFDLANPLENKSEESASPAPTED